MKKSLFVIGASACMSGCGITAMDARINPQPQVQASEIGKGLTVAVSVVDERPSKTLGKRSSMGGVINLNDDLAAIYQRAIIGGLRQKGFNAVGDSVPGAAQLRIEIRGLQEMSSMGLWTMGTNISAAIKVYADSAGSHYEQMYRDENEHRTVAVSGAEALNAKINAVVNHELEQMFADQMLLTTLAKRTQPTG